MVRNKKHEKEDKKFKKPTLNLSQETKRAIVVVIFVALALLVSLALAGIAGIWGEYLFRFLSMIFGVITYVVPLIFLLIAIALYKQDLENEGESKFYLRPYVGTFLLTGSIAGLIHIFEISPTMAAFDLAAQGQGGGYLGAIFAGPAFTLFGFWAGCIILAALFIIGVLVTFDISLRKLFPKRLVPEKTELAEAAVPLKINAMGKEGFVSEKVVAQNKKLADEDEQETVVRPAIPAKSNIIQQKNDPIKMDAIILENRKDWTLPPFDLLDDNHAEVDSGNIEVNVAVIKKTLSDFGIEVEMGEVNVGPTVTQYTLRPATGVKLSQIAGLQNDLALALAASSLRMELPIPGKALVGLEVPNKTTAMVRLREVMQTKEFVDNKSKLAVALGRDVAGHPMIVDLAKMPHLLIAGATGTGKSVAINSLFISLLYRNTPQDVKFIVIDPKRVEMTPYNGIPHLLTPVITDHEKAVNSLKWAVAEMDRRYKLLADAGKRNIAEYNEHAPLPMPYIVILVDELADLMSVAQADVEATIVRLSQMARAIGIHLVLATQRPS